MRNNVIDYYRALAVTLVTVYHIQMGLGKDTFDLSYGFNLFAPLSNGWIGVGIFLLFQATAWGCQQRAILIMLSRLISPLDI